MILLLHTELIHCNQFSMDGAGLRAALIVQVRDVPQHQKAVIEVDGVALF